MFSEDRRGGLQVDLPQPTKTESAQRERVQGSEQGEMYVLSCLGFGMVVGLLFLREMNSATGS